MDKGQCLLVISDKVADILDPTEKGYKICESHYAFDKVANESGELIPQLQNGVVQVILQNLPVNELIEWGLTPKKCQDCAIVTFDEENKLLEK